MKNELVPIQIRLIFPSQNGCAIFLGNDEKIFVIQVEPHIGHIIGRFLQGQANERPLTHDLCKSLIVGLGAQLQRVNITKVENRTYFAELLLVRNGEQYQVDARPSDSIAIALRTASPVFAADSLLLEPPEIDTEDEAESMEPNLEVPRSTDEMTPEQLKQYLSGLRPEDFGKFNP